MFQSMILGYSNKTAGRGAECHAETPSTGAHAKLHDPIGKFVVVNGI